MLSVADRPFMLSVIMLGVVAPTGIAPITNVKFFIASVGESFLEKKNSEFIDFLSGFHNALTFSRARQEIATFNNDLFIY